MLVEGPMGIIEAFNEPVSDRVGDCLVAVALLEIEPGPGEGILDVMHDPGSDYVYAFWMEGISLGR